MKTIIKLSDFLKTGKFGTVAINDSIESVIEKLGPPEGDHNPDVVKPKKGIHYGMYEFIFNENKIEFIQNDHFDIAYPELMEYKNDVFEIDPQFLRADRMKKMEEIEAELNRLEIKYHLVDYWGRRAINTEGNVIVDFDNEIWSDEDENFALIENATDYQLIGIRYHPKFEF